MSDALTDQNEVESVAITDQGHREDPSLTQHVEPPEPEVEAEKPISRMDAIKKAAEAAGVKADDDEKADAEDAKRAEASKDTDKKPAKVEAEKPVDAKKPEGKHEVGAEDDAADKPATKESAKRPDGKPWPDAPAKFLPKAKEVWANVPNVVKTEIARIHREHEAEVASSRQAAAEYEPLKPYAEMAKRGGTDLKTALDRYVGMEDMLRRDPVSGIREILSNLGLTPQQYAQHVLQNPQAHAALPVAQAPRGAPRSEPQGNPEVDELREVITRMQQKQVEDSVIAPFASAHPRYEELKEDIAFFLNSGKIPTTLSPAERLEAAYDMAERINPSSVAPPSPRRSPSPGQDAPPDDDLAGQKSVRGAPGAGVDTTGQRRGKMSRQDAISRAMAEMGIRG